MDIEISSSTSDSSSGYLARMEFRVLGPLEVVADGRRYPLGGPKPQTILALLIASAGRRVSTDSLIDVAYGEDAPSGARRSVQTYISTLRRDLGDTIRPEPGGYLLDVAGHEVDAIQFQEMVGRAASLDDPREVSLLLRTALGLWRGHPYAGLDGYDVLAAEVSRLDELRLAALERRIDAELALGHHKSVVPELEALTAEHPLREGFWAQQMLALYRSGRQAEALRTYGRLRERLGEELGIEPSTEVKSLEQRMLEQDSSLTIGAPSEVGSRAVLVVDLAEGSGRAIQDPTRRRSLMAHLGEAIDRSIESNEGSIAAQTATATYVTFHDVRQALSAASDVLRNSPAAEGSPILRLGLDVGDVEEQSGGVVTGPAVIRAAGLAEIAHAGQALLSADAQREAAADSEGGWVLRSLGAHQIARLESAEVVHQLVVAGLPTEFPPLRPGVADPIGLPGSLRGIRGYELRDEIGRGKMGTVHRGYQPSIGREVAIKVVRPELANDPNFIRRFAVEAQMVARIEHSNVVPLYDFWRSPDGAMLVMRLMRGGSLADQPAKLGSDQVGRIMDQIGGALATAHDLGVAHGDVSATNVLLNESGDYFLSDFGVAGPVLSPGDTLGGDVAAAAQLVLGAAAEDALSDAERQLLHRAVSLEFGDAADLVARWRAVGGLPAESPTYTPTRNPYKGLAAFTQLDARDFHGREAVVEQTVARLGDRSLIALVGPSGVGKSSVVRAGLLPALRAGALPGSTSWLIADMLPGADPFDSLARALGNVASRRLDQVDEVLRDKDRGLLDAVERFLPQGATLLLVVDQLEELFTLATSADRDLFLGMLAEAIHEPGLRVRVVATVRADFFDQPLRHREFGDVLRAGTVPVPAPTEAEMRRMIVEPANGVGVSFEPGLVERIVGEVRLQPGALPLLEFALTDLFERRESDVLSLEAYEASGGVAAALGRRAEAVFSELAADQRPRARQVFMRLVNPGDGGADTRRRVRLTELGGDSGVRQVLSLFGDQRLLTFDNDEVTRGSTVEVAHEALLAEWPRLTGWIDAHREELLLRGRLSAAAADWERSGRSDAYLLSGGRLAQHEGWVAGSDLPLSDSERSLMLASRQAVDEQSQARRRVRQRITSAFAVVAALGLVLAVVAWNSSRAAQKSEAQAVAQAERADDAAQDARDSADLAQRNADQAEANAAEAIRQSELATGRALLAATPGALDTDPDLGLLLALGAAERLGDSPEAAAVIHEAIAASRTLFETATTSDPVSDISPDGSLVAVPAPTGLALKMYEVDGGALRWTRSFDVDGPGYHLFAEFINDGSEVMAGVSWQPLEGSGPDPSGQVGFHIFDAATGEALRRIDGGHCGPARSLWTESVESSQQFTIAIEITDEAFEANGCQSTVDGFPSVDIDRLDVITGERVRLVNEFNLGSGPIEGAPTVVALSSDGRRYMLGPQFEPEGQITVAEVGGEVPVVGFAVETGHPMIALSPDGTTGVTPADFRGSLWIFDVDANQLISQPAFSVLENAPLSLAFTPDGSLVSAAGEDGSVTLFEVVSGRQTDLISSIGSQVTGVRFSRTGDRVLVMSEAGVVRVTSRNVADLAEVSAFDPCGSRSPSVFFFNRGLEARRDLVTTYAICDFALPGKAFTFRISDGVLQSTENVFGQAFAATHSGLAAFQSWRETTDGRIFGGKFVLGDLETGEVVDSLEGFCEWDWDSQGGCADGGTNDYFNTDLELSDDGVVIAVAGGDTGYAWNRSTGVFGDLGASRDVAVSRDGTLVVGSDFIGQPQAWMRVYDGDDFSLIRERIFEEGEATAVRALTFHPNGTSLVGIPFADQGSFDILSHDLDSLDGSIFLEEPHEGGSRDLDFSADGRRIATVGADGFARVWDVESKALLVEIRAGSFPTAVAFAADDSMLVVTLRSGPVTVYHLDFDALLDEARTRIRRGYTESECTIYFPTGDCPSLEEVLSG